MTNLATAVESNRAVGSRAERPTSYEPADHVVPTGREEEWRFTPIDRLQEFFADPAAAAPEYTGELPTGVTSRRIEPDAVRELSTLAPEDRPSAYAANAPQGALLVEIPANTQLTEPVVLTIDGDAEDGPSSPVSAAHLALAVGRHAEATVVLRHHGRARFSERVSVRVGDGAHVTVVSLQEWEDTAQHLGEHTIEVGRDATVRHIVVTLGGELVRLNTSAKFAGPGGNVELLGLYYTDAHQHQEHRLFIDHSVPNCISRATYKGALQGAGAHSVWVGDVLIGKDAEGTDTYELNRNLVLTEGAMADSVPNLEIETGEIEGAGHASATGRFDDEQLFYLMSRGVGEQDARRLVVRGFFAELINQIGVPEIQEKLMASIEDELARTMGAA